MAKQDINYGSEVGDPTAESVFDSFKKSKENFDELYSDLDTAEGEIDTLQTDVDALEKVTESAQIESYVLVLTDNLKLVTVTTTEASTLTVPPNSAVAFPVGATIAVCQGGAGTVTITAGEDVIINSADAALALTGQWATCSLIKTATDTWLCTGSLE
jgi:hypothetical protein